MDALLCLSGQRGNGTSLQVKHPKDAQHHLGALPCQSVQLPSRPTRAADVAALGPPLKY